MIWIFRNICVLLLAWWYDIMGIIHENLFRKIKNKKIKLFNYWKKVKSYPIKLWSKGLKILKQAPRKKKKIFESFPKVISLRSGPGKNGKFIYLDITHWFSCLDPAKECFQLWWREAEGRIPKQTKQDKYGNWMPIHF